MVRFRSPSVQTGKFNISIHNFGYWFQLIIWYRRRHNHPHHNHRHYNLIIIIIIIIIITINNFFFFFLTMKIGGLFCTLQTQPTDA
jgi:hypothetical protein